MVCTAVTTICGVWLAYGEPPNLIMKANLYPHLGNAFFLLVLRAGRDRELSRRRLATCEAGLTASAINLEDMDVIDANAEDVRFLQATRHGEVLTPIELVEGHADGSRRTGRRASSTRMRDGESLGLALVHEDVPSRPRRLLLGHFVSEELADGLDRHYLLRRRRAVRGGVRGGAGGRRRAGGDGAGPARAPRRSAAWR